MATARALVVHLSGPDGERPLALPVSAVRQVVPRPPLTPVPTAPPLVLGLANVRGDVVPVLDPGVLLDADPVVDVAYALVIETSRGLAALAAAAMPTAAEVDDSALFDPEALLAR